MTDNTLMSRAALLAVWATQALLLAFALKLKVSAASAADGPAPARLNIFQVRDCQCFACHGTSDSVELLLVRPGVAQAAIAGTLLAFCVRILALCACSKQGIMTALVLSEQYSHLWSITSVTEKTISRGSGLCAAMAQWIPSILSFYVLSE